MPVDKFGRTQKTPSAVEGVSLSYISRNFQRKGDIIDMTGSPIVNLGSPRNRQDAATKNYVLETIERLLGEHIQISGTGETVTKSYVDDHLSLLAQLVERNHKPVITVVAEESGPMQNNQYEWSFGNGVSAVPNVGYPMPAAGRIIKGCLCTVTRSGITSNYAKVNLVKNGYEQIYNSIEKADDEWSGSVSFDPPLEVNIGDRINFVSKTSNANVTAAVVSVLIELDV